MKYNGIQVLLAMLALPLFLPAQNPFALPDDTLAMSRDIYGEDSRREAKSWDYNGYTQAVLTQMPNQYIEGNQVIGWTLKQSLMNQYPGAKVDPELRFQDQPAFGNCTGFLIAPDIMVTAGHCVSSDPHEIINGEVISHKAYYDKYGEIDVSGWSWVFDYTNDIKLTKKLTIDKKDYFQGTISTDNQYKVKKIIHSRLDRVNRYDYAVFQLDRETSRDPFRFRISNNIAKGENLAMIGSPAGLPLKLSDGAQVTLTTPFNWFGTNLDAFGGNSGGPVYNKSGYGWIEGILVRGRIDRGLKGYYLDSLNNLIKEVKYADYEAESIWDDMGYEMWQISGEVQRITSMALPIKARAIYGNLSYAIRYNDMARLEKWMIYDWAFIKNTTSYVVEGTNGGDPPGVLAIENNRVEMFKKMVDAGMDPSAALPNGKTMLTYAIEQNNTEIINIILKEGYNLEQKDDAGYTPIFWAISNYNSDVLALLLKNGASVNATTIWGNTPLHNAVIEGSLTMVQMLIEAGASVNAVNYDQQTPIKVAKKHKQKEIKKYLKKVKKGKV